MTIASESQPWIFDQVRLARADTAVEHARLLKQARTRNMLQ